jgi:RimJ/RimL family protein N-acetyltransferase
MNLQFKKITSQDVIFVNSIRNQYAKDFLHDSRTFTNYQAFEWFSKTNPDFWIIFDQDKKIGYFRLSNYSKFNNNIYIGADISPEFKGLGYGKESYKKFIPFIFKKYNLNKISLEVLSNNEIAISLYKKLGFVQEGVKRGEVNKNGYYIDSIVMSILKKEYYGDILEDIQ